MRVRQGVDQVVSRLSLLAAPPASKQNYEDDQAG
jgi:hypothetical protein